MNATTLPHATIRLNAAEDLAAASLDTGTADQYARAYRAAAEAICEGIAEVTVEDVAHDAGCDAAWAQEYGLWQAAHDCVDLDGDEWYADEDRVAEARRSLRVWMVRNVPGAADALGCPD